MLSCIPVTFSTSLTTYGKGIPSIKISFLTYVLCWNLSKFTNWNLKPVVVRLDLKDCDSEFSEHLNRIFNELVKDGDSGVNVWHLLLLKQLIILSLLHMFIIVKQT